MRDEFIRFQNYKNSVALPFRVRCVSAFSQNIEISKEKQFFQRASSDHSPVVG